MARPRVVFVIDGDPESLKKALKESERLTKQTADRIEAVNKRAQFAGKAAATAFAFDIARNIRAQSQAASKLEAILKSTGNAAGVTADEMKRMATAISGTTLFSAADVTNAQAILATFTNIRGQVFESTLKAATDLSAAFDQDLKSSIIQVGKALNDPIKGVTALSDIGVTFTDAQRELIKSLVESNRLFEAQRVIIDELQRETGGAAEAVAGGPNSLVAAYQKLRDGIVDVSVAVGTVTGDVSNSISKWLDETTPARMNSVARRRGEELDRQLAISFRRLQESSRTSFFRDASSAVREAVSFGERPEQAANGIRSLVNAGESLFRSVSLGAAKISAGEQVRRLLEGVPGGAQIGGIGAQPSLGAGFFSQALQSAALTINAIEPPRAQQLVGRESLTGSFGRIQNAALQDRAGRIAEKQLAEQQKIRTATERLPEDIASSLAGFLGWQ